MATQSVISVGATGNDGSGDPLRTAFIKCNQNFSGLWTSVVYNNGTGFTLASKTNNTDLNVKTLIFSGNVIAEANTGEVIIRNNITFKTGLATGAPGAGVISLPSNPTGFGLITLGNGLTYAFPLYLYNFSQ